MKEIWKDIQNYEGFYQISNLGRMKSVGRYRKGKRGVPTLCKEKMMTPRINPKTGYSQIHLAKDGVYKAFLVHRLVAFAFLEKPLEKNVVDHINGVRSDNRAENLRWCTTKENMNYDDVRRNISICQKTNENCIAHQKEMQNACRKPVVIVWPDGTIKEYPSITSTEKDGFEHSHVAACCKGKLKYHRKCKCFYKDDYYAI